MKTSIRERVLGLLGAALLLSLWATATAQAAHNKDSANKAQVMFLGMYHFENPKLDYAKNEVADVMSLQKQQEIAAVVAQLARFKPTKIMLEAVPARSAEINDQYAQYLKGAFQLSANEIHQLGFRVAKQVGLQTLHPIDHRIGMDLEAVINFAKQDDPEFLQRFNGTINSFVELMNRMQKEKTIPEILAFMNQPEILTAAQQLYVDTAGVGKDDNYIGADVVTQWYKRNLRIYANLARVAKPGDKILVIFGQGHVPILQQLVRESGSMKLVNPLDYLKPARSTKQR